MKKDINKKEENIVLDEETKKDEKKKPTVKKIVFATILILLAVVFVVLGFCLCLGAFDRLPTSCNVANAVVINDSDNHIGTQYYSGISFDNYTVDDLNTVYGFFVNQNFVYNENECPFDFSSVDVEEGTKEITLFTYSIDNIGFEFKAVLYNQSSDDLTIKGFLFAGFDTILGGDFYYCYLSPDVRSAMGVSSFPVLFCGRYLDFGENHIENFQFTTDGLLYKDYIGKIINFSGAFSSGSGISQDDFDEVVADYNEAIADRDRIQQEYNDFMNTYHNAFSYVPILYKSPSVYSRLERKYIDKNTTDTIFIISEKIPISDIIDNAGNLIYNIQPDVSGSGLWERYFTMNSFNDFHAFLYMANSTPLSYKNGDKGILYSYDSTYHSLIKYSDPVTFATVQEEQLYNDIKQQHYNWGKSDAEKSKQSSIDGIISVLQSPVNFLKNVFSFEVFGINVSGVVFFILSIVIVAFVIKKVV